MKFASILLVEHMWKYSLYPMLYSLCSDKNAPISMLFSLHGWEIDIVSLMSGLEGVAIRTNSSDTKKMD